MSPLRRIVARPTSMTETLECGHTVQRQLGLGENAQYPSKARRRRCPLCEDRPEPVVEFSKPAGLGVSVSVDGRAHGMIKDLRGLAGGWLLRIPELPIEDEARIVLAARMRGEQPEGNRVHFRSLPQAKKAARDAIRSAAGGNASARVSA